MNCFEQVTVHYSECGVYNNGVPGMNTNEMCIILEIFKLDDIYSYL